MASMLRVGYNSFKAIKSKLPVTVSVRNSGVHEPSVVHPHKGKVASDDVEMPDQLGHAVGKERYELLCKLYGWDDPYLQKPISQGKGTWEEPYIAYSWDSQRTHWCQCANTGGEMVYQMNLVLGLPKRCQCGYWLKLMPAQEPPFLKDFKWPEGDGSMLEGGHGH